MALSIFHHKSNLSTVELEQLYSKNHQHSNHVNGYTNSTQQSQSSQKIFSDGEAQYHRQLWGMHMSKFLDAKTVDVHGEGSSIPPLPPYDFRHNIAVTPQTYRRELFILYYDPTADEFQVYIDETKDKYYAPVYSPTHGRLKIIMPILTYALRNHFPDRLPKLSLERMKSSRRNVCGVTAMLWRKSYGGKGGMLLPSPCSSTVLASRNLDICIPHSCRWYCASPSLNIFRDDCDCCVEFV